MAAMATAAVAEMVCRAAGRRLTGLPGLRKFPIPSSGAIAQLGERLHGMQEVGGSIPPSSTKTYDPLEIVCVRLCVHLESVVQPPAPLVRQRTL